jgi:hypothetical protein
VVQKLTPTVSLVSSPNPSVTGQLVTFTATVSGSADTPTGTVTFTSGSTTLATATVSSGAATATFALTASGLAQNITAHYGGDTEYVAANSAPASQTVSAANTVVALTASSNPALSGSAVTFTATVSPVAPGQGTPVGNVAFYDSSTLLGTVSLSGGVATLTTSSLSAGTHNISAQYGSTTAFNGSTSSTVSESIGSPGSATVLASSPNPSVLGSPVTLTATVTSGGTTPQGSVTFYNGASQIGTANLSAGVGSISLTSLPAGTSTLTATYSSSNSLSPSTSGPLSQVVLVPVTVQALPAAAQITVDGTNYTGPQTFNWVAGSSHSLSAPTPQILSGTSRLIWSSWSNGAGAAAQAVTAPSAATTYTATFLTQYLVSTPSNPAVGGSVSGGGYYTAGTTATVTATANSGYSFYNFSGDVSGTTNPISFTVNGPVIAGANFATTAPRLGVTVGTRTDGSDAGTRNVGITLLNNGGTAYNAQITAINVINTIAGSGTITLVSGIPGPSPGVTLAPGASVTVPLVFNWPDTATRAQISFRLTATDSTGTVSYPVTQAVVTYR